MSSELQFYVQHMEEVDILVHIALVNYIFYTSGKTCPVLPSYIWALLCIHTGMNVSFEWWLLSLEIGISSLWSIETHYFTSISRERSLAPGLSPV